MQIACLLVLAVAAQAQLYGYMVSAGMVQSQRRRLNFKQHLANFVRPSSFLFCCTEPNFNNEKSKTGFFVIKFCVLYYGYRWKWSKPKYNYLYKGKYSSNTRFNKNNCNIQIGKKIRDCYYLCLDLSDSVLGLYALIFSYVPIVRSGVLGVN